MHGFDFAAPIAFLLLPLPFLLALWRRRGVSASGGLAHLRVVARVDGR